MFGKNKCARKRIFLENGGGVPIFHGKNGGWGLCGDIRGGYGEYGGI